ncbi:MAG TPA: ATP-binding protein [Allosphingosinicella sp.]|nr:ATP-binding protein [Allosphingosinicella sp.]
MGEKLLAQRILALLRDTEGRQSKPALALLEWAADQHDWLWPDRVWADPAQQVAGETLDWTTLPRLIGEIDPAGPEPAVLAAVDSAADLLQLGGFDRALLRATAALERLPRLAGLRTRLLFAGADLPALAGRLAGVELAEAAARVRRSEALSLGLLHLGFDGGYGTTELALHWRFSRILEDGLTGEDRLVEALAGIRQTGTLGRADFVEHDEAFGLLERLLAGALRSGAVGVNVLIWGPPGTGKTEFARTLAAAAGASLFAVGEADMEGEEPLRTDRLHALKRAQRLLGRRPGSLLLFDEIEDLFDAWTRAEAGRRAGSKIYFNRLLEEGAVPVIWTSNALAAIDPAHLRRMSYVLRMDHPSPKARARIAARAAEGEGAGEAVAGLAPLLAREAESASVARVALRTASLAGGSAADAEAAARSLLLGLRGGRSLPPAAPGGALDLALYEADAEIAPLLERLSAPGAASDFSLLLTGPPGTGKTALAAHVAERLDRPLRVKRASDLLSKWVGETEANIAEAFAEARDQGAVLLFDEADSLLLDRGDAQRSWEITQVNEMLTWMDLHPLPFVAATNFARRLDPAALRRFVFKIELRALSAEAAARAFERFFGEPAPAGLARVGGLTPGDFALVKRQLRYRPEAKADGILALLEAEAKAKPEQVAKIGF